MQLILNFQNKNKKEELLKAIGEVKSSIGKDLNAALKRKVEEILLIAESYSETYMNEFQKLNEQNENLKKQISFKFKNLHDRIDAQKEESKTNDMDEAIVKALFSKISDYNKDCLVK